VDSGRSCERNRGTYLPLTGVPIYYHRCMSCGFLFTADFDGWSVEDFSRIIYNDSYAEADPDYLNGSRAKINAAFTANVMNQLGVRRILDYGGGTGTLARTLLEGGFEAQTWDPVADRDADPPGQGYFDLVTAFEVFEHTTNPIASAREALSFLQPGGRLFFSTMVMDDLPRQATDHWYIAPRNGHVSLHTRSSLRLLFEPLGWLVHSFNDSYHITQRPSDSPTI